MWAYGGFNLKRNILKLLLNNCFRIYFVEIIAPQNINLIRFH
jgi:hypothetical protein